MNLNTLSKVMLTTWYSFGAEIDDAIGATLYLSVPRDSDHVDAHGNTMAGAFLAKRIQDTFREMGATEIIVKYKIRDEYWTEEKYEDAKAQASRMYFGRKF